MEKSNLFENVNSAANSGSRIVMARYSVEFYSARVCLKIAFCKICFSLCGRFGSNLRGVAGYID